MATCAAGVDSESGCDARILTGKVRKETPVVGVIDKRQMHGHDTRNQVGKDDQIQAQLADGAGKAWTNNAEPNEGQKIPMSMRIR